MIYSIYSDLSTFKNLDFHDGFNLLLCDKTEQSTEHQTRNRAGKTSLIEIIHFLMGSNANIGSIFRNPRLENAKFQMRFDLGGKPVTVQRSGANAATVYILEGDTTDWIVQPQLVVPGDKKKRKNSKKSQDVEEIVPSEAADSAPEVRSLSNTNWKLVLGALIFDLKNSEEENVDNPLWWPTFRSLFSYFVRREADGAFTTPETQSTIQQLYDSQVAIMYLLDLDWRLASEWKQIREKEKSLGEIKKAAKAGTLGTVIPKSSDLRTRLAVAERQTNELRAAARDFRVLDGYSHYEKEASDLTQQINESLDQNTFDDLLIREHEKALSDEMEPSVQNLEALYQEVGIIFPDKVTQRLEDARAFHRSVIDNRKSYLQGEINQAQARIAARNVLIQEAEKRRRELYALLHENGALEQLLQLQEEVGRAEGRRADIESRYRAAQQLESKSTELEIERKNLQLRLNGHFDERETTINRAITLFEEASQSLHEEDAGSLTISDSANGPKIAFQIQGSRSKGINRLQIFCFDLVIARLCAERKLGPSFLVHDSHLFDGVDPRQVRWAFEKASAWADEFGFQYLVVLNSDLLQVPFSLGFEIQQHILDTRLTDDKESGGLFGFRFE